MFQPKLLRHFVLPTKYQRSKRDCANFSWPNEGVSGATVGLTATYGVPCDFALVAVGWASTVAITANCGGPAPQPPPAPPPNPPNPQPPPTPPTPTSCAGTYTATLLDIPNPAGMAVNGITETLTGDGNIVDGYAVNVPSTYFDGFNGRLNSYVWRLFRDVRGVWKLVLALDIAYPTGTEAVRGYWYALLLEDTDGCPKSGQYTLLPDSSEETTSPPLPNTTFQVQFSVVP